MTAGRPIEGMSKINVLKTAYTNAIEAGPFEKPNAIKRAIDEFFKVLTDLDDRMAAIEKRLGLK